MLQNNRYWKYSFPCMGVNNIFWHPPHTHTQNDFLFERAVEQLLKLWGRQFPSELPTGLPCSSLLGMCFCPLLIAFFSFFCFPMLCSFLLYNEEKQLYLPIYPFLLEPRHPSHLFWSPQSTVLSSLWVQQLPTSYLFYRWWCVCVKVTVPVHLPQPCHVHTCVL